MKGEPKKCNGKYAKLKCLDHKEVLFDSQASLQGVNFNKATEGKPMCSVDLDSIHYNNFICYFESNYIADLSAHRMCEQRILFLQKLKAIAEEHQQIYEIRHGQGSYNANLKKYGNLKRSPLQIIEGDFNSTHLLMPKLAHNYITTFNNQRNYSPASSRRWANLRPR